MTKSNRSSELAAHKPTRTRKGKASLLRVVAPFLLGGLSILVSCADVPSGEVAVDEPVAESGQAVETCLSLLKTAATPAGAVDADVAMDPIDPTMANINFGLATTLTTGRRGVGTSTSMALLRFDLSAIPVGATITSAAVTMAQTHTGTGTVSAHRITAPWSEATVTYNSFANAFAALVDTSFSTVNLPLGSVTFDLQPLSQAWVNGTYPNYGLLLEQPATARTRFRSSDTGVATQRPHLDICYVVPAGCVGVVCTALDPCHVVGACDPLSGTCSNPAAPNGTTCSDGSGCTSLDTCQAGVCAGGAPVVCAASDACHAAGSCNPATGVCSNPAAANGTACNDGNACTQTDTCVSGVCTGGNPTTCAASGCHAAGVCDPTSGACSTPAAANGTACDDGNACTTGDTCLAGACVGGSAPSCTDGNACTDDTCSPALGCVHANNTAACNDGNPCTQVDACSNGACVGASPIACQTLDQCHAAGTCDATTGLCSNPAVGNGTACNDGNACTTGDTCVGGICTGGPALGCDDANACTNDTCSPATGCVHANNTASCSDANACTTNDTCSGGVCVGGPAPNCDDANGCTNDSCSQATGCLHINNVASCNDGNACTTADTCANGACVGGAAPNCADSNACTDDTCSTVTGCVHTNNAASCTDGNACTQTDTCSGGVCVGSNPVACAAPDQCHVAGTCNTTTGTCSNPPIANNTPCDDGNACTTNDKCTNGVCTGGPAPSCDDGVLCTTDSCNNATGCVHTNNVLACDDGNACTQNDKCANGVCAGGPALGCGDGNACTDDSCSPATGCVHTNNTASCNDGNACTQTDTCSNGSCVGANPVVCVASDGCHVAGTCATATGLCSSPLAANSTPCNDGNACTTVDVCQGGVCVGGTAPSCDDTQPCTTDTCDTVAGCVHTPNAASCNDGNPCTTQDTCSNGTCVGGPAPACDDLNACTVDSCNPATGCLHTATSGNSCSDLSACTTNDTCAAGVCVGGAAPSCDDSNPCTVDTCSNATGCVHTNNAIACDDGNACTSNDTCSAGVCAGTGVSGQCNTGLAGVCAIGALTCSNGVTTCNGVNAASAEVCDGLDNDCDLSIDEGSVCGAQPGTITWSTIYDAAGGNNDANKGVAVDASGNVFVAGNTFTGIGYDVLIQKYSSAGVRLWVKTYAGSYGGDDEAYGVAVDSSGNVIVGGYEDNGSDFDFLVLKYDTNGTLIWNKLIGTPAGQDDYVRGITTDGTTNIYFAGSSTTLARGLDVEVYKLDSTGTVTGSVAYNSSGTNDDYGFSVAYHSSGIAVAGSKTALGNTDGVIQKFPLVLAAPTWTKTYVGVGNTAEFAFGVAVDTTGAVIATGTAQPVLFGQFDQWVRKLSSNGNTINWTQTFAGAAAGSDYGYDVCADSANDVIVTGYQTASDQGANVWIRKYGSAAGATTWTSTFDGPAHADDYGFGCAVDASKNVYLAGSVVSIGATNDTWVAKYLP